jgi:coenzyme Q-binding protein COQ10
MPRHHESMVLVFKRDELFALVADVASYPQFLPWCVGARLYGQHAKGFDADLLIGFKMFKERFTSRVILDPPNSIRVDYIKGPMKYLHNDWLFRDAEGGTEVDFTVDFEFKNPIFEKLVGNLFEEAVIHMIAAFAERAQAVLLPFDR